MAEDKKKDEKKPAEESKSKVRTVGEDVVGALAPKGKQDEGSFSRLGDRAMALLAPRGPQDSPEVRALLEQSRANAMDSLTFQPVPSVDTARYMAQRRGAPVAAPPVAPPKDPKTGDRGAQDNQTARAAGDKATAEMGNTPSSSVDINNAMPKTSLYGEEKGTTPRVSAAMIPGRGLTLGDTGALADQVRGVQGAKWTTKPMGAGDEATYAKYREEAKTMFPGATGSRGSFVTGGAADSRPFSEQLRTMSRPAIDMSKKGRIAEQTMSSMGGPFAHAVSTTYELSGPEQAAARQEWIDRTVAREQGQEMSRAEQGTQLAKLDYERRMAQMDPGYLAKIQAQSRYGGEYLKLAGEERLRQELSMIIAPLLEKHAQATDPQEQRAIMEQVRAILSAYGRTPPSLSNPGLFFGSAESVGGAPAAGGQS